MHLYNTLTSQKEPFKTAAPDHAKIYVCGPTVYDYSHLGHARCYIVYDILVRFLRATGKKVTYVRNITDIDDKIVNRAEESGTEPKELSEKFTIAYNEDMARLGNVPPSLEPKVSEHLEAIFNLIQSLINKKHAYVSGKDVYFDVASFKTYGKLSHRKLDDMLAGASGRVEDHEATQKKNAADFALWKSSDENEYGWKSPWGHGRPGWHIECSAMAMVHLGESFDLHGGGLDLVFPHHENEIAQSEAATGKTYAHHWMHNGFVECNKEKMSKSLGNFFTVRELFNHVEPEALRYSMLTMHYRAPLNFEWTLDDSNNVTGFPQFEEAEKRLAYLYGTIRRLNQLTEKRIVEKEESIDPSIKNFQKLFYQTLEDDLNMPAALAHISEFLKAANELLDNAKGKKGKISKAAFDQTQEGFKSIASVFGLGTQDPVQLLTRIRNRKAKSKNIDPAWVEQKIQDRTEARAQKDFTKSDQIRDELTANNIELMDGPDGTEWSFSN